MKYLFIDGNCLRTRLREVSKRYCGDAEALNIGWWAPAAGYRKVFYYDAVPVQKSGESAEEYEARRRPIDDLHSHLQTVDRYHVYEGDARYRRGRGQEQKKVDVMIAVDMLTHTIRRNMDETALLAGDVDFKPLLDALVNEGMFVTLIYPPGRTSRELLRSADARQPMTVDLIHQWLDEPSRALLPVPSYTGSSTVAVTEGEIARWDDQRVGETVLYRQNDEYVLQWRQARSTGASYFLRGRNLRVLLLFAEDDHQLVVPELVLSAA